MKLTGKCNTQEISDAISDWKSQAVTTDETYSTEMATNQFHNCTIEFNETTPHGIILHTALDNAGWIQDLE